MGNESLVDKINRTPPNAKVIIGIPGPVVMNGIISIFNTGDQEEIKRVFEAYQNWNSASEKLAGRSFSRDQIYQLMVLHFEWLCSIADNYLDTGKINALPGHDLPVGPVRRFYRDAMHISDEKVSQYIDSVEPIMHSKWTQWVRNRPI